jgi:DNA/RNA endonuclease YhcR with UshA esterase domain
MDKTYVGAACMSVAGLLLIYVAASSAEPESTEIGKLTGELTGRTVTVEGEVKEQRDHKDGHIFLTLTDGGSDLDVPVFSNLAGAMDTSLLRKGAELRVTGAVDEYRGKVQVVPRKPEDLEFLGWRA